MVPFPLNFLSCLLTLCFAPFQMVAPLGQAKGSISLYTTLVHLLKLDK